MKPDEAAGRVGAHEPEPDPDRGFPFWRGLLIAIPVGLAIWALIILLWVLWQ